VAKPVPNFTRVGAGHPDVAILIDAMLRAREVVATRSWSTSQESITEAWWADVLADPRASTAMAAAESSRVSRCASGGGGVPTGLVTALIMLWAAFIT
jgi:hypothetical protein